mmetsp:Transcript_1930/g.5640  ORF Transcript_1930/g.5640 Transcript_1930/m.5640 type:complete len:364 (+) Transcript_1930:354-1445(+)
MEEVQGRYVPAEVHEHEGHAEQHVPLQPADGAAQGELVVEVLPQDVQRHQRQHRDGDARHRQLDRKHEGREPHAAEDARRQDVADEHREPVPRPGHAAADCPPVARRGALEGVPAEPDGGPLDGLAAARGLRGHPPAVVAREAQVEDHVRGVRNHDVEDHGLLVEGVARAVEGLLELAHEGRGRAGEHTPVPGEPRRGGVPAVAGDEVGDVHRPYRVGEDVVDPVVVEELQPEPAGDQLLRVVLALEDVPGDVRGQVHVPGIVLDVHAPHAGVAAAAGRAMPLRGLASGVRSRSEAPRGGVVEHYEPHEPDRQRHFRGARRPASPPPCRAGRWELPRARLSAWRSRGAHSGPAGAAARPCSGP